MTKKPKKSKNYKKLEKKVNQIGELVKMLIKIVDKQTGLHQESVDLFGMNLKQSRALNDISKFIIRSIQALIFLVAILYWRVFLWEESLQLLGSINSNWDNLDSSSKNHIITFISMTVSGLFVYIIGKPISMKIEKVFRRE